ncbi:MAG: hypothetical protein CMB80_15450 [Flammeovirgaceae bacterium]|nr:hypothetical protein [Flammeovirgaceae bacterium]MBE61734.1 hypothetical protein [Flammeovirgaceae bacterium]MBR08029.1 hypothetical protein [Rickettsiales bacterium]
MQSQLYVGKVRPLHIDKSQLANYQFKNSEVLSSKEAIRRRWVDLNRGTELGKLNNEPCTLIFESEEGELISLEAHIWAVTMKSVILQSGRVIPIKCIHNIIF